MNHYMPVSYTHLILPEIKKKKTILIAAHGNSLRALVMQLRKLSPEEIINEEIPTGKPLIYELNDDEEVVKQYYLG